MIKVVFFGTPAFSAGVLEYLLLQSEIQVVGVVSNPDRPRGRSQKVEPTPVKALIKEKKPSVPVFQPLKPKGEEFYDELRSLGADIFVVVAYGAILTSKLIEIPPVACINLHTSLLPKYRGAAPIQRAILAGESESGVSIMHIVKQLDAGDVIRQKICPIGVNQNATQYEEDLLQTGKKELVLAMNDLMSGTAGRQKQDDSLTTYAAKIDQNDLAIDLKKSCESVVNQVRAFSDRPGAFLDAKLKESPIRLKVFRAKKALKPNYSSDQGLWKSEKNRLIISCGNEALELLDIQLPGKKRLPVSEVLKGAPLIDWAF